MNRKRIALYCCAALVAAGVGLNIQNAIADYGIGENSLSLVATGGTGSGSCFESVSFATCTYTVDTEVVRQTVQRCGRFAGKWVVKGLRFLKGKPGWVSVGITAGTIVWQYYESQKSHYLLSEISEPTGQYVTVILPDNTKVSVPRMVVKEHCGEVDGSGDSDCDPTVHHDRVLRYTPA